MSALESWKQAQNVDHTALNSLEFQVLYYHLNHEALFCPVKCKCKDRLHKMQHELSEASSYGQGRKWFLGESHSVQLLAAAVQDRKCGERSPTEAKASLCQCTPTPPAILKATAEVGTRQKTPDLQLSALATSCSFTSQWLEWGLEFNTEPVWAEESWVTSVKVPVTLPELMDAQRNRRKLSLISDAGEDTLQ